MRNGNEARKGPTWIIAAALSREAGYHSLIDELDRAGQERILVRKDPHASRMIAIDADGREMPEALDSVNGPTMVIGTVSMSHGSRTRGWSPGYVDVPEQSLIGRHWGEAMLNHDAVRTSLGMLTFDEETAFVRPDGDDKAFTGTILDRTRLERWREDLVAGADGPPVSPTLPILRSSPRTIWSEYRLVMVEGRYVTGSRYRTAGRTSHSPDVGSRFVKFAEALASTWNPADAYALDLADTPDGIRVVEVNPISSAGFYCMDMRRFVDAIVTMISRTTR